MSGSEPPAAQAKALASEPCGARHTIELLAALFQHSNFSVGCYCENEAHCHRSGLRTLLAERGAKLE